MRENPIVKMEARTKSMLSARDEVLRRVGIWLKEKGFQRAGVGHYTQVSANLVWNIGFQKMGSGYNVRVMCHVHNKDDISQPMMGPWSDLYECPNSPNGKKYVLRWNTGEADIARCAKEYCDYINEVVIEWFRKYHP